MVVTFPFVMVLILLVVQFAMWQHAVHVAETAAAEGLAVARADGGSAGVGQAKASTLLSQLGRSVLRSPSVSASRTADAARVEIFGVAPVVVPFLELPVHAVAAGPVERFRGDP
ncbi:pilus assembly protein [Nonomuraea recticatena]|uniref:Pilus assembly protein n=1 Tax=Nonomuraea recticatena TaxID=46178 RepID=A0ABP6DZB5_9ACTN